jgi:S1-C subfamily serine protease
MKRFILLLAILSLLVGCITYSPQFAPEFVITKIRAHTVSIATYYIMDSERYQQFMDDNSHGMIRIPVQADGPKKAAAVIGSGTIVRNNHVLTVRHMFDDHYGVPPSQIWVFIPGWDHAVEADLVCKSEGGAFWNDYAVIKLREKTRLPGLRIGDTQPLPGDRVINTGSPGGFAFFTRYSHITEGQYYFTRGYDEKLHLTPWENFPYMVIKGGGPGDSGGSICNIQGELVGIMYCGITNYSEEYIFANPTSMLHDFLEKNGLGYLR